MKHPSLRLRLMVGTGLLVAAMLFSANLLIYRSFEHTLSGEIEKQLLQSSSILGKSAELEATSLDYEWQEAMASQNAPEITGLFQFWDLSNGITTRSPDLGEKNLPFFHGKLNETVVRDIVLQDGSRARAVGLLHLPFTDETAIAEAAAMGKTLRPEDHPQVLVCVQETESMFSRLRELKALLIKATCATLLGIWGAIFLIASWCFRPISQFSSGLLDRTETEHPAANEIPPNLPSELVSLATAFNTTLDRVERSRAREKEFALHAAHELRTPVAGILVTLEQAIARPRDSRDLTERIGEALKITSGMRITLDSLMRLARLRGGLEKSSVSSFNPMEIIHELADRSQTILTGRHLALSMDAPPAIAPLENDAGLFRILVSNLMDNAVTYAPEQSAVALRISDSRERLIFQISNACGDLRATDLGRLFQPFQRGEVTNEDEGHAGLGLSLAKEAARILGGELDAEIESGVITFTAILHRLPQEPKK